MVSRIDPWYDTLSYPKSLPKAGSRRNGSSRDDVDLHRLKLPTGWFTPHYLLLGSLNQTYLIILDYLPL